MNYWLMKSEPDEFSIDDLNKNNITAWEGVRNYQARNFMRDQMKKGDMVLFYHSSCKEVGVAGIAEVIKESHPDLSAQDINSPYYDPKATKENPRWFMVSLKFVRKFSKVLTLKEIKEDKNLANMIVIKKGNRLSITPVDKKDFDYIFKITN